jgi:hypothetical protein
VQPDLSTPAIYCPDPWGRLVIARQQRWDDHIAGGHPELINQYEAVETVIRVPDRVMHDATFGNRENFYRALAGPPRYAGKWLKVCIAYGPGNFFGTFQAGEVVTAYITSKIGKGERQKWP